MNDTAQPFEVLVDAFTDHFSPARGRRHRSASISRVYAMDGFFSWYRSRRREQQGPWPVLVTDFAQGDVVRYMDAFAAAPTVPMNQSTQQPVDLREVLDSLNFFGTWLVKQGHLRCNPFAGIPMPKPAKRRTRTETV